MGQIERSLGLTVDQKFSHKYRIAITTLLQIFNLELARLFFRNIYVSDFRE